MDGLRLYLLEDEQALDRREGLELLPGPPELDREECVVDLVPERGRQPLPLWVWLGGLEILVFRQSLYRV